jgi:hypothetical protein
MKLKRTMLAVLAGTAAIVSAPAFADRGSHEGHGWRGEESGWHEGHGWRGEHGYHHGYYYAPRPRVIYAPQSVYSAPAYYPPAPAYSPAPTYYQPAPVYAPVAPGISIRLRLPL